MDNKIDKITKSISKLKIENRRIILNSHNEKLNRLNRKLMKYLATSLL